MLDCEFEDMGLSWSKTQLPESWNIKSLDKVYIDNWKEYHTVVIQGKYMWMYHTNKMNIKTLRIAPLK